MATLSHSTTLYSEPTNWLARYNQFVEDAEFNRVGWSVSALMMQGCILSPILLLTMAYMGGGDWQFLASMFCFLLVLIPILSAQKVKYIFGGFYISFLVHLLVIAGNVFL
ncbi:hypothetical protein [Tellurirhabdus bombi]|uniref:hypothetical protein n=1 Tax=Tellurirhabdus bombi TaxID=2907205 RepID=UPI001F1B5882|nr:hypothetical protein [Tellurirhabdus bombi]